MNSRFYVSMRVVIFRFTVIVSLTVMRAAMAGPSAEELKVSVSEVAPGVYRLRAGEPERIVPSMVKLPALTDSLAAMPKVEDLPLPLAAIHVVRMARGCRIELPLANSEVIYGLGLQCKHLEQNGWRRTLFAMSGDNDGKGMSHAPVPFYVSTAGYGVLVDSARYLTFSIGEKQRLADVSSLQSNAGERKIITDVSALYGPEKLDIASVYVGVPAAPGVDIYLFAGPAMGDAIARYNLYSGGGCLPSLAGIGPRYIFGAMLNGDSVLKMCDQFKQDQIPVTTTSLEPGWHTHAYSSSYLWDTNKFNDHFGWQVLQKGYDMGLWCQLYLDPSSPLVPILGNRFGDFEVWRGVVPDLADRMVRSDYRDFLVKNFLRKGIRSFKLDEVDGSGNIQGANQEWQFPEFTTFPSGADGELMHNLLGRLGLSAIDEAFRQENRRTFGLVRANQAFAAPLPAVLYSDEYDFPDYLRYNLSAGVQGLLWEPEVRDARDFRDYALRLGSSTFSAMMVIDGWQFPNLIWRQPDLGANERNQLLPADNPYAALTRRFADLRMMLMPYLYQAYGVYHRKGISPVHPLVADWPEDANTRLLDDEWMLGSDILIAPITDKNAFTEMYRVELTEASQFKADPGVLMKFQGGVVSLDIASAADGLPGGSMEFDLKAGPCVARFSTRGDLGQMSLRLRRVENGQETDVGDLYKNNIRMNATNWSEQAYQFNVEKPGHYRLLVGKGYTLRLPEPKRLELRDVEFEQKQGGSRQSWQRQIYFPAGNWRDFWTGAVLSGGGRHVLTASAENPPVFVRDGTLLPLAEPLLTISDQTVFKVHLAAYGDNLRPCKLLEDDGATFDYERGKWATITVHPNGTVDRPEHGQPQRYHIAGQAEAPAGLLNALLAEKVPPLAQAIQPGEIWPDNRGQRIDAHGGGITRAASSK